MAAQFDAVAELTGAFKVLFEKRNWMLALAVFIGNVVCFVIVGATLAIALGPAILALITGGAAAGSMQDMSQLRAMAAGLLGFGGIVVAIGFLIAAIASGLTQAWVTAAADNIWQGRDPDLAGGLTKAFSRIGAIFVAGILIFLMAIIPIILSFVLIGILLLIVLGFFLIYVMPAIVISNDSGGGAIGTSFRLARENGGPTIALLLGLVIVVIVSTVLQTVLNHIPFIGIVVSIAVSSLLSAYIALAIVRFYRLITGSAARPSAAAPPAVPPTT